MKRDSQLRKLYELWEFEFADPMHTLVEEDIMEFNAEQKKQYDKMCRVKDQIADDYLKRPDVTGIGVGLKEIGGKLTDEFAIIISVKEKKDVPAEKAIPAQIKGFITDVIEFNPTREPQTIPIEHEGEPTEILPDREYYKPLVGGISIGPTKLFHKNGEWFCRTGTLGLVVYDKYGRQCALTSFHVLGVSNSKNKDRINVEVSQPSRAHYIELPYDEDIVICRAQATVKECGNHQGLGGVDCAILPIRGREARGGYIVRYGFVNEAKSLDLYYLRKDVYKRGCITGETYGQIQCVNFEANMHGCTFENQIQITGNNNSFSEEGDSGSVVVLKKGRYVIGLLMGGGKNNNYDVANPFNAVMDALKIRISKPK